MSHFTVLVVGDNVERQLQPFHEFECTGVNDQYVQDVDKTSEFLEEMESCEDENKLASTLSSYDAEEKVVADESEVDRDGAHKYGYAVVRDGQLIRYVDRTNANKKWDWWLLGGRWTGYWKLKPGRSGVTGRSGLMTGRAKEGYADQARKGDIDFDGMRKDEPERVVSTFAVLLNGRWYEKGQMGWWSMVSKEKDEAVWNAEFAKLLDGLPDDALLSVVDCHI